MGGISAIQEVIRTDIEASVRSEDHDAWGCPGTDETNVAVD
jgi:hypothetical protein